MSDYVYPIKSGFYDAINHDRLYSADDMNEPYKRLFTEGILDGSFAVSAASTPNMTVSVAAGFALLLGKWVADDGAGALTVPENTSLYGRIDSVVIHLDKNSDTRAASLVYRTGTPAAEPSAPALIVADGVKEVRLANITVAAGATAIDSTKISDQRGTSACPYMTVNVGSSQLAATVEDVLEAHPEWTTTVQDGSITIAKLASGVIDNTLTQAGAAADAKKTGDEISGLKDALSNEIDNVLGESVVRMSENHYDPSKNVSGYLNSNGTLTASQEYKTTDFIYVRNFEDKIQFTKKARFFLAYDQLKQPISASYINELVNTVEIGTNWYYIRASFAATTYSVAILDSDTLPSWQSYTVNETKKSISNDIHLSSAQTADTENIVDEHLFSVGINKCDPSKFVSGYIAGNGKIDASQDYKTTDFIDVSDFQNGYYINKQTRFIMFYDGNKEPIIASYVDAQTSAGVIEINSMYSFVRYTLYANANDVMVCDSASAVDYSAYANTAKDGHDYLNAETEASVRRITNDQSVLSGKKWFASGDSFVAYTNATFDSGIYQGHYKTYPYLIALRNGMNVINEAVSGSTMANVTGHDSFCVDRYLTIPEDADYITLQFGINDEHEAVPIGTIDSEDDTTFYGAWNKVLNYITQNFPFAHVGIICGNGMYYASYTNAIQSVADKWGIPCLNMVTDKNVPLMNRVENDRCSALVRTRKDVAFRISADDTHPNYKAHEYESTFIENWLRSL